MHRHRPEQEVVAQGEMILQPTSVGFLHTKQEENRNEFNKNYTILSNRIRQHKRKEPRYVTQTGFTRKEYCGRLKFLPKRQTKIWLIAALSGHQWLNNSCYFPTTHNSAYILPHNEFSQRYIDITDSLTHLAIQLRIQKTFSNNSFLRISFCRHHSDR